MIYCDGCGSGVGAGAASATVPLSQQFRSEFQARSMDAWRGLKLFARNPVAGLPESFALFEERRAIQVGLSFALLYELAIFFGIMILKTKVHHALGRFADLLSGVLPLGPLTVAQMLKVVLLGLVPFASLIAAGALARAVFHGTGRLAGDIYTAGAVLIPSGLLVLIGSVLGIANMEVILVLSLFALTYSILMLYAGCSRIMRIPEIGAAPAVPIMLLASAWITKILMIALW
jgi:hypothetical protein